jgi:hypothetical protein
MSCFASEETLQTKAADPTKHVNYVQGMVLGVDDFDQEFTYLSERGQWLARDLIGYGTASGLAVTIEDSDKGKRVAVSPGVAVSPRGQLIRVAPKQCAVLDEWLKGAVRKDIPTGTTTLPVYVVLCYRDCPIDEVPILGEPCRTEEESMAPSRIVDDFRLELRLDPPAQREEDAVRDFVAWLRQIEIVDFAADPQDLKNFLDAIRAAAQELPSPIDFLYGSPPSDLFIPYSEVCEWLRAAFGLWVTELRPLWQSAAFAYGGTSGTGHNRECLLLAEVDVPVLPTGVDWSVDPAREIVINSDRRPFLFHLRMLQEWLLYSGSSVRPADPRWLFQWTSPPYVVEETGFGRPAFVGTSLRYAREDHTHGSVSRSISLVEHTHGKGQYFIVAAGHFKAADGARIGRTYNNLRVKPADGPNEYIVTFGPETGENTADVAYLRPKPANAPRFMYMVKGTPVTPASPAADKPDTTFNVVAFTDTGIQIRVVGGTPQSFMIEISLFGDF